MKICKCLEILSMVPIDGSDVLHQGFIKVDPECQICLGTGDTENGEEVKIPEESANLREWYLQSEAIAMMRSVAKTVYVEEIAKAAKRVFAERKSL